jgi:GAF domain-containing protein
MQQTTFFRRWNLVAAAAGMLDRCRDLPEVLEVLRERARAIADADGVAVVLRDGDEVAYVGEDAIAPLWTGRRFRLQTCISGLAMLRRAPIVIPDIRLDDRVPLSAYLSTFVQSMAVFPIGAGEPVAALGCYWARTTAIEPGAMTLVETLARSANGTLERLCVEAERAGVAAPY